MFLQGVIVLIALQLLGEFLSAQFSLSVPGSVIGMLMLLALLVVRGGVLDVVGEAADGLIKYIGLLFVPAGAGISLYLGLIAENWVIIVSASLASTVCALVLSAVIFKVLARGEDT